MSDKINELLQKEVGFAGFFYIIGLCLLAVFIIYLIIKAIRTAYIIEAVNKTSAHSLFKSILIGIVPALYFGLSKIDVTIPKSIVLIITAVILLIVAIWNFSSFGVFGSIVLTFVQCIYALLTALCVMSVAFIIAAGIVAFIAMYSGGIVDPDSGTAPSILRDVRTNETFHVSTHPDGTARLNRNGTYVLLRPTDYSGRYRDDYGNEYV